MRGPHGLGRVRASGFAGPANAVEIGFGAAGVPAFGNDLHQRSGHFRDGDGGDVRKQGAAVTVALAFHRRTLAIRQIIQDRAELILDQRALVLDHDHTLQAFAERPDPFGLKGPRHGHLVHGETQTPCILR